MKLNFKGYILWNMTKRIFTMEYDKNKRLKITLILTKRKKRRKLEILFYSKLLVQHVHKIFLVIVFIPAWLTGSRACTIQYIMELTTTFAHYFQLDICLGHIDIRALLFDEMQVACRNVNGIGLERSGFVMTFKEEKLGQFVRKINRFFLSSCI